MFRITRIAPLVLLGFMVAVQPAVAGPPLLCHPFDIGAARSLPWDGSQSWSHGRADYNRQNLVADTAALLTPSTPVIVRMETLRRAALYASEDAAVAARLLAMVNERAARGAERAATADPGTSLALFDAGYLTATFKQIAALGGMSAEFRGRSRTAAGVLKGADGYALLTKSIALRPDDPALQFAAALVSADNNRAAYQQHAAKARQGADKDALLTRNLKHIS
jgi:hypothetical protein